MNFIVLTPQQVVDRFHHNTEGDSGRLGTVMSGFLHRCQEHKDINTAIESGGWLAGGFVRNIILGRGINQYFRDRGDIDVFFPEPGIPNKHIASHSSKRVWNPSPAGNAMQRLINIRGEGVNTALQFINHEKLCHPTLHETLGRFDLLNSAVGWDGKHFHIPVGWQETEESGLIFINRADSPFLGGRISKYLNLRGLRGIHPDSIQKLKDWVVSSSVQNFENCHHNGDTNLSSYVKSSIFSLFDKNNHSWLDKSDALLFLSKWSIVVKGDDDENDYGINKLEDWALHTIQNWRN